MALVGGRHGYLPGRAIVAGVREVGIRAPKVHDRNGTGINSIRDW